MACPGPARAAGATLACGFLAALAMSAALAGELLPGDYGMPGGSGLLAIRDTGGVRRFVIDTVGANGHVCHLEGRLENARALPDGGDGACAIVLAGSGDRVEVRAEGEGCRYYCGMRAGFAGSYVRMRSDCLPGARERRNEAFRSAYRARRYDQALGLLERTERECGRFFGWAEQDAFANDKAITLYHLGRHAQCLDVLRGTRAAVAHDEASLDEAIMLPPSDRELYLPIARSTWHNLALCRRAAHGPQRQPRSDAPAREDGRCDLPDRAQRAVLTASVPCPPSSAGSNGRMKVRA